MDVARPHHCVDIRAVLRRVRRVPRVRPHQGRSPPRVPRDAERDDGEGARRLRRMRGARVGERGGAHFRHREARVGEPPRIILCDALPRKVKRRRRRTRAPKPSSALPLRERRGVHRHAPRTVRRVVHFIRGGAEHCVGLANGIQEVDAHFRALRRRRVPRDAERDDCSAGRRRRRRRRCRAKIDAMALPGHRARRDDDLRLPPRRQRRRGVLRRAAAVLRRRAAAREQRRGWREHLESCQRWRRTRCHWSRLRRASCRGRRRRRICRLRRGDHVVRDLNDLREPQQVRAADLVEHQLVLFRVAPDRDRTDISGECAHDGVKPSGDAVSRAGAEFERAAPCIGLHHRDNRSPRLERREDLEAAERPRKDALAQDEQEYGRALDACRHPVRRHIDVALRRIALPRPLIVPRSKAAKLELPGDVRDHVAALGLEMREKEVPRACTAGGANVGRRGARWRRGRRAQQRREGAQRSEGGGVARRGGERLRVSRRLLVEEKVADCRAPNLGTGVRPKKAPSESLLQVGQLESGHAKQRSELGAPAAQPLRCTGNSDRGVGSGVQRRHVRRGWIFHHFAEPRALPSRSRRSLAQTFHRHLRKGVAAARIDEDDFEPARADAVDDVLHHVVHAQCFGEDVLLTPYRIHPAWDAERAAVEGDAVAGEVEDCVVAVVQRIVAKRAQRAFHLREIDVHERRDRPAAGVQRGRNRVRVVHAALQLGKLARVVVAEDERLAARRGGRQHLRLAEQSRERVFRKAVLQDRKKGEQRQVLVVRRRKRLREHGVQKGGDRLPVASRAVVEGARDGASRHVVHVVRAPHEGAPFRNFPRGQQPLELLRSLEDAVRPRQRPSASLVDQLCKPVDDTGRRRRVGNSLPFPRPVDELLFCKRLAHAHRIDLLAAPAHLNVRDRFVIVLGRPPEFVERAELARGLLPVRIGRKDDKHVAQLHRLHNVRLPVLAQRLLVRKNSDA